MLIASILSVLFLITFHFFIHKKWKEYPLIQFYWIGLGIKIIMGILLGIIYLYYYQAGDTYNFYVAASNLAKNQNENWTYFFKKLYQYNIRFSNERGVSHSIFMETITSFLYILSNGNYWLISMYCSCFSFLGFFYLANKLAIHYPTHRTELAISFLFYPSIVFWSSGIMKESIALGCLFFVIGCLIQNNNQLYHHLFYKITLSIFCIFIIYKLKFYYLPIAFGFFGTYFFVERIKIKLTFPFLKWGLLIILPIVCYLLLSRIHHTFYIENLLMEIVNSNHTIALKNPSNTISFYKLNPTVESFLINIPIGLFSGLFRPTLFDSTTWIQLIAGIENTILFIIFCITITKLFFINPIMKTKKSLLSIITWMYILVSAILFAFVCPNLGSLVRYKILFLPFFIFLLLQNSYLPPIRRAS